jgi:hypothetical protein
LPDLHVPLKYCGYYPPEAERLAVDRDVLRSRGKYDAADALRDRIRKSFGVDVVDGPSGYQLYWHNQSSPVCDICKGR